MESGFLNEVKEMEKEAEALLEALPPIAKVAAPDMYKRANALRLRLGALRETLEFEKKLPF